MLTATFWQVIQLDLIWLQILLVRKQPNYVNDWPFVVELKWGHNYCELSLHKMQLNVYNGNVW